VVYLVSAFGGIDDKDSGVVSDQNFNMSAESKLWRDDCPAVWWFVDVGVCQGKWSWFVKVGDGNQPKISCQCNQSCSPELYIDDSVILCLLLNLRAFKICNGQQQEVQFW